jgi:hypothetical protein
MFALGLQSFSLCALTWIVLPALSLFQKLFGLLAI